MLTMARSRSLLQGYEPCPDNPVMSNRSLPLPIQSVGHADLVEDQNGNWWAVCLGTRTFSYPPRHNLGRETMLVPVDFSGEWPVFGNHGSVLEDADRIAWLGRRQQHHVSTTVVTLDFSCAQEGEEAGLTIFMNNHHHYDAALIYKDGCRKLILRRQIGTLWKIEKEINYPGSTVEIMLQSDMEWYVFFYRESGGQWKELGGGETIYLTTEVGGAFSGNYIGLYSVGNGKKCVTPAVFRDFCYQEGKVMV